MRHDWERDSWNEDHERYLAMQRMAKISREMREREEKFMGWFIVIVFGIAFIVVLVGSTLDAIYA